MQEQAGEIHKRLLTADVTNDAGATEYSFKQEDGPGRFTVEVRKKEKNIPYDSDGGEITFYLFANPEEGGG